MTVGEAAPLELPKVIEGLVCEFSISGFESRQLLQIEGAIQPYDDEEQKQLLGFIGRSSKKLLLSITLSEF